MTVALASLVFRFNENDQKRTDKLNDLKSYVSAAASITDAIEALGTGIIAKTANGTPDTFAARSLTAPAAGLAITNPAGIAGDPTFALANDLAALEALAPTGIPARTGTDSWSLRTITGTANQVTVTNGAGILGDPTISLPSAITAPGSLLVTTTFACNGNATLGDATTDAHIINGSATVIGDTFELNSASPNLRLAATGAFASTIRFIHADASERGIVRFDSAKDFIVERAGVEVLKITSSATTLGNALGVTSGGTGLTSCTQGDIFYASATNTISKLAAGTSGYFLQTQGAGANPQWASAPALVGALVSKSADQTAANYTTQTAISFDTEQYDTNSFHPVSSTVTITIASPGVVTWTGHNFLAGSPIVFTTTGALPTGLTAGTTYYVVSPAANTFQVAATVGGAAINTSGSQSGTHTATNYSRLTVGSGVSYVMLEGAVGISSGTTTDWTNVEIRKNGALVRGLPADFFETGQSTVRVSVASSAVSVTNGDYFELFLQVESDTSITVSKDFTWLAMRVVGA